MDDHWGKSSYSTFQSNCVQWKKSSYSFSNGNCVETADGILVRDSQDPDGPVLGFTPAAWMKFVNDLKV